MSLFSLCNVYNHSLLLKDFDEYVYRILYCLVALIRAITCIEYCCLGISMNTSLRVCLSVSVIIENSQTLTD